MVHLNAYESLLMQRSSQGMEIDEELRGLILMSNLPPSWETFITTVRNTSTTTITYVLRDKLNMHDRGTR